MISIYQKSMFADLKQMIEEYQCAYSVSVEDDEGAKSLPKLMEKGKAIYPIIALTTRYEYITDNEIASYRTIDSNSEEHTYEFDFKESMPVTIYPSFTILATDISQMVELEELILNKYSDAYSLTAEYPNKQNEKISFVPFMDDSQEIERSTADYDYLKEKFHQTILKFKCENCVSFSQTYHPAQLEFDKYLHADILQRLVALGELQSHFNRDVNIPEKENKIKNIQSARGELCSMLNIPDEYREIADIEKIYKIISESECDIKKAIEQYKQIKEKDAKEEEERQKKIEKEKRREEAKIRRAETIFSKTGDEVINRFTDPIIEDIKIKVGLDSPICVYGGSTFTEFYKRKAKNTLEYPCILVHTDANFVFGVSNYTNINQTGIPVNRVFSTNIFPISYGVKVEITAKDRNQVKELESKIEALYTGEVQINIPDPIISGEFYPLHVMINPEEGIDLSGPDETCHYRTITFKKLPSVYHVKSYGQEDVENNPRLQFRLLQQAQFSLYCFSKIKNEAIKQLECDYKNLISRKNVFFGLLDTPEYKRLRNAFNYGQPIDRNLFNSVLNKITIVYPNLYDKMMSGVPYEGIKADLEKYADYFAQRWLDLCNLLSLPEKVGFEDDLSGNFNHHSNNPRSNEGLVYCIDYMDKKEDSTLKEAISDFEDYLYRELRKFNEQIARESEYEERSPDSGSSSSGGFFSSMLSTAGGVAIGNTGSRREERKQTQLMREQAEREKERDRKAELERWRNKSFSNGCGHNGNNCFNCPRRHTCTHPSKH